MAHAAGVELDRDLVGTGIRKVQLFEKELSTNLCLHSSYGFHQTDGLFWSSKCFVDSLRFGASSRRGL